jgi:hypothetical protein
MITTPSHLVHEQVKNDSPLFDPFLTLDLYRVGTNSPFFNQDFVAPQSTTPSHLGLRFFFLFSWRPVGGSVERAFTMQTTMARCPYPLIRYP